MNIILRYLEISDLDNLLKIENDERYWHLAGTQIPFTKEELSNYIENAHAVITEINQLRFVIDVDNQFAGLIDLYEYDSIQKSAGVGIILFDEFQKKGIAQASLNLLIDYCKEELNVIELFARIENDNLKSIILFEKCGFKEIKHLPNYLIKNGERADCKEYILK